MELSKELAKALSAVPCLECGKPFRLPKNVAEIEFLECPHCQANLSMTAILEEIAEEFEIPTAAVVQAKTDHDSVDASGAKTTDVKTSDVKTEQEAPEISHGIDEGDYFIPKPLKTATRRRHLSRGEAKYRRKRSEEKRRFTKKKGGVDEYFRVAFGAILALPIAQLILWWVFGADPFSMGPKVSRFAPILVPARMEAKVDNTDANSDELVSKDMPDSQTMHDEVIPFSLTTKNKAAEDDPTIIDDQKIIEDKK